METRGHHALHGGLRGHSTGPLYPWGIMGRVIDGVTYWQPWNLTTGETCPLLFRNHEHAEKTAQTWKERETRPVNVVPFKRSA